MVQLLWYLMALTVHTTVSMSLFTPLLSGKRYRALHARTTRMKNSCYPSAVTLLNAQRYTLPSSHTHTHSAPHPLIFLHSYNRVNPKVWLFEMFTLSLSNKILFHVWASDSWLPTLILHPFLLNMKNSKLKVTLTIMWMSISCLLMLHLIKTHICSTHGAD